jgi:hypothetical protein
LSEDIAEKARITTSVLRVPAQQGLSGQANKAGSPDPEILVLHLL